MQQREQGRRSLPLVQLPLRQGEPWLKQLQARFCLELDYREFFASNVIAFWDRSLLIASCISDLRGSLVEPLSSQRKRRPASLCSFGCFPFQSKLYRFLLP